MLILLFRPQNFNNHKTDLQLLIYKPSVETRIKNPENTTIVNNTERESLSLKSTL